MASPPSPPPRRNGQAGRLRGFHLDDDQFATIRRIAHETAGIALAPSKRGMVVSRLSRRLRALGCSDFASYLAYVSGSDGREEVVELLNSITTNVTSFFREAHHFEDLATFLEAGLEAGRRRFRLWSAACATGEEAYSIAMVALHACRDVASADVRILATDIDTNALEAAAAGRYSAAALADIDDAHHAHFEREDDHITASETLREMITFRRLNLIHPWPITGPLDAVFCRNVTIYFDQSTKMEIHRRMAALLRPSGRLYIGHAETADARALDLVLAGRTTYASTGKETRP